MPHHHRYTATYRRLDNSWRVVAEVPPGPRTLVTTARTLDSARAAIVAAIAQEIGTYAGSVILDDAVRLPGRAKKAIKVARDRRNAALTAAAQSRAATSAAASLLLESGLSLRDAGYLLGLSHAAIRQSAAHQEETA